MGNYWVSFRPYTGSKNTRCSGEAARGASGAQGPRAGRRIWAAWAPIAVNDAISCCYLLRSGRPGFPGLALDRPVCLNDGHG
jgi:hypothetical protein